jgi:microcystin-dependent protein
MIDFPVIKTGRFAALSQDHSQLVCYGWRAMSNHSRSGQGDFLTGVRQSFTSNGIRFLNQRERGLKMNFVLRKKSATSLMLVVSLLGSAAWSTAGYACADGEFISSVCIMAATRSNDFSGFTLANGASLPVNQYAALYSLIGNTYGGNQTAFQLPDLRGRMVVGAGIYTDPTGKTTYMPGQKGGAISVQLTSAQQLPAHNHTLSPNTATPPAVNGVAATVNASTMTATTTLTGLTTTTNLGGVNVSGAASGLTLNASSGGNVGNDPTGKSLGTTGGPTKVYSDATPNIAMNSKSIGGNLSLTIANGTTAPGSVSGGTAVTTLNGAPTVSVGGMTDITGTGGAVATMPPYVAMNYYIAVQGVYPSYE